jgi:hypothetical protein
MDIVALGQACEVLCGMPDDRIRGRDPVSLRLRQYRHDGLFDLSLSTTPEDGGYLSQGSARTINWIPGDGVYHGYPKDRRTGPLNYRYDVPMAAYLPNRSYDASAELGG